jgi:hypothetical protein
MADLADGIEPALALALADELVDITELLSALAQDLAADPATLRRHMRSLQAVDRVTQTQLAVAGLLRAGGAAAGQALDAVVLEDVAARVKRRLAQYRARG